jgi:hypothetical protein
VPRLQCPSSAPLGKGFNRASKAANTEVAEPRVSERLESTDLGCFRFSNRYSARSELLRERNSNMSWSALHRSVILMLLLVVVGSGTACIWLCIVENKVEKQVIR